MSLEDDNKNIDKTQPQIRGMYKVLPYLYIGDGDTASEKDELKRLKITHILNCASEDVDNFFPEDFTYEAFPIEDVHDAEPSEYFEKAFEFIGNVKEEKTNILVHCTTGKNIAPTIVTSYMLLSAHKQGKHLPLLKALQHVQAHAPGAQPSDQFTQQLIDLEKSLYDEVSIRIKGGGGRGGATGGGRGRGNGRGGKGKRGK